MVRPAPIADGWSGSKSRWLDLDQKQIVGTVVRTNECSGSKTRLLEQFQK